MITPNYELARRNMIEGQIRPNKVTDDRIVEAMSRIPRELFVPDEKRDIAYCDEDIELGNGRFLIEPMVFARMIQHAEIKPSDMVLDIGCATGYSTAVLAFLANTVVAIEEDKRLVELASETLNKLDILNAAVLAGKLSEGYPAQAPYDVIVINGCVDYIPDSVLDQLADGGRLVTVVEDVQGNIAGHFGHAVVITRNGDSFETRSVFDAATLPLKGFEKSAGFVF